MNEKSRPRVYLTVVAVHHESGNPVDYDPDQLDLSTVTPAQAEKWIEAHIENGYDWMRKREHELLTRRRKRR